MRSCGRRGSDTRRGMSFARLARGVALPWLALMGIVTLIVREQCDLRPRLLMGGTALKRANGPPQSKRRLIWKTTCWLQWL
jgi:hypothetical protein